MRSWRKPRGPGLEERRTCTATAAGFWSEPLDKHLRHVRALWLQSKSAMHAKTTASSLCDSSLHLAFRIREPLPVGMLRLARANADGRSAAAATSLLLAAEKRIRHLVSN